jgi:hypothetical protein
MSFTRLVHFQVRPALMTYDETRERLCGLWKTRERACVWRIEDAGERAYAGYCRAICRNASPTAMAAAIATLSERRPPRIGMTRRASAALCT